MIAKLTTGLTALALSVTLASSPSRAAEPTDSPHRVTAPATCSRSLAYYPKIRPGAHRPAVRTLQCFLNDAGADLTVDGIYGPVTKQAVLDLVQRERPSYTSGVVKDKIWMCIIAATLPDRRLANGSRGHAVLTLQRALWSAYYGPEIPFALDGIFGPQTEGYLKTFQGENGLTITGVANRRTRAMLHHGARWYYEG